MHTVKFIRIDENNLPQEPEEYDIKISHFRPLVKNPDKKTRGDRPEVFADRGGYTAISFVENETVRMVVSRCSQKDRFNRKAGIQECLLKLCAREMNGSLRRAYHHNDRDYTVEYV